MSIAGLGSGRSTSADLKALFRLGRELRYRPLPIIGQRFSVQALEAVEPALDHLVDPWRTAAGGWHGCDVEGGIAKYGLIDRARAVAPAHLVDPATLHGVPALRENSFESDFVHELARELGSCELKVFIEDDLSHDERFRHNHHRYRAGLPPEILPEYFPRAFTVVDACITNAPSIWLSKHFYL
jgi:hypothetical protein